MIGGPGASIIPQVDPPSVPLPDWLPIEEALLLASIVVALYVVYRIDRTSGTWLERLRSRFLFGVPWGTLTSVAIVLAVYLFVQGGWQDPRSPVTLPFRAWSYFDPLGVLLSGFSHASYGHIRGNLIGTLALAPLAEYAFGHFPRRRERTHSGRLGWLLERPYARAFVVFPGGVVIATVLAGVFSLGPVIGFSSVVYAFAGFALLFYPIGTIVALTAREAISATYFAVRVPQQVAVAEPTFSTPWFASIAVQGHALGLFLGVFFALVVINYRGIQPTSALRLFTGALLYAVSQSLWAVYWFRGGDEYVLFRAIGMTLVFVLATIIVVAAVAREEPLFPSRAVPNPETLRAGIVSVSAKQLGMVALLLGAAIVMGPAIPVNLTTADDGDLPGDPIEIRGYEMTYGEDVPDGMVNVVDIEAFGETTQVNTSGVIVRNTDRHIWMTDTSASRLAFDGRSTTRVGGIGWQETVVAERSGWVAVGDGPTYRVTLRHDGDERTAFTADPVTAEPIVAGANVSIETEPDRFVLNVTRENRSERATLPEHNESVELAEIVIHNDDDVLYAEHEASETIVRVAEAETYDGRR